MEKLIIKARLVGLSINQLEGNNLQVAMDQIILAAASIVGCPTPSTELYASHLSQEMITYLNDFGYGELTQEEIFFAFRLNTNHKIKLPSGYELSSVPFEGICFNITFLSKVLYNYSILRNGLDRKMQNFIEGYE